MIKIKFIIWIAITTSISTTNSRYLLFKLKDESNKGKNLSSREDIEIDPHELANLMGYSVILRKTCTKSIHKYGPGTKMRAAIEKCDKESLCKGIFVPNCEDLKNGSKEICIEYEKDNSTGQKSCFWMKNKLKNCPWGEISVLGKCKCGNVSSCYLNENAPMCDSANNRCLCGPGEPECGKGENCEDEKCSVDGRWGEWEKWSTCHECKRGVMKTTRECNVKGNGKQCVGKAEDFKSVPVNCDWSSWEEWNKCSQTCGLGSRLRHRRVTLEAINGGVCNGSADETGKCNDQECCKEGYTTCDKCCDWNDDCECDDNCFNAQRNTWFGIDLGSFDFEGLLDAPSDAICSYTIPGNKKWCCEAIEKHNVKPRESYGSLTMYDQRKWDLKGCDHLTGGKNMWSCAYGRCPTKRTGHSCIFPFDYGGKEYRSCAAIDVAAGEKWCYKDVNYKGKIVKGQWGHCRPECEDIEKKGHDDIIMEQSGDFWYYAVYKGEATGGGGGGCFHGSNMVHLQNGKEKLISDVEVGDSVLVVDENGITRYSQVIIQLHKSPEETIDFRVIRTKTGRNITLTDHHLIYKTEKNRLNRNLKEFVDLNAVFAKKVRKGDFVFVLDRGHEIIQDEVVSTDTETRKGMYSPVTAHGTIIVEDILASCYSDYESHSLLHLAFAPFRWLNDGKELISSLFTSGEHDWSEYKEDNNGHHWYSEALVGVGKSLVPEKVAFD